MPHQAGWRWKCARKLHDKSRLVLRSGGLLFVAILLVLGLASLSAAVLWAGVPLDNVQQSTVLRSENGGVTWEAAGLGINGERVSPILIDPQAHHLLYVVAQGPRGRATLY